MALLPACSFQIEALDAGDLGVQADLSAAAAPDLVPAFDIVLVPDLAPPPDIAGPCGGRGGVRLCEADTRASGRCDPSAAYQIDRVCTGAGCQDGHCRKPQGAPVCRRNSDCAPTLSCQLFTTLFNSYGLFCAPPPGTGAGLSPCTVDSDCQSNTCYPLPAGRRCLRPCASDADCDGLGRCGPIDPTTEGFRTSSSFCG